MRRGRLILYLTLLLAVGAVCALRWQAWFGMPTPPEWQGEIRPYHICSFGDDSIPGWHHSDSTGWCDEHEPDTLDMMVLGDVHSELTAADYLTLCRRHPNLDAYAQLGDWTDRSQTYYIETLKQQLDSTPLRHLPVLYCPGNHEYTKGLMPALPAAWDTLFTWPGNGPLGLEGTSYWVDLPHVRYIVVDTQRLRHLIQLTRLNCWLERAIQTRGNRYTVVMMHHPILSTDRHRFNPGVFAACAYPCIREADVVFSGHDHSTARRTPLIALSSTKRKRKHYNWRLMNEWHQEDATPCYAHLTVIHDTLRVETRSIATGLVLDSVVLTQPH